jgi:hypothetical protein
METPWTPYRYKQKVFQRCFPLFRGYWDSVNETETISRSTSNYIFPIAFTTAFSMSKSGGGRRPLL